MTDPGTQFKPAAPADDRPERGRRAPVDGGASRAERLQPQNIEAEQAVLGAVLIDNEAMADLCVKLRPADFYRVDHSNIYAAMLALYDRRQPIDYVTVLEALAELRTQMGDAKEGERLEWVDVGMDYLAEMAERVPTSANVQFYAAQVRQRAILRELIRTSVEVNRECYDFAGDLNEFLDTVEQRVFAITQRDVGKQVVSIRSVLHEVFTKLDEYQDRAGALTGVPSGFSELDELTGGFQDGEMIVLAARPSMGKTTSALSISRYIALKENMPIAFFSCEMGRAQIVQNMLCAEAKINSKRLRSGYLDEYEYDRIVQAANRLADAPLFIDDTPGIGLREVRAKARRLRELHGIRAIFIDYLQLMSKPPGLNRSSSREQEIATISRGLKALARELSIPVIVLAQLNRDVEKRTGSHRPRMSDLRESGSIEQDADVIALLHREEYYTRNEEDRGKAELILAKQRNGPTGTARLLFRPEFMRFDNPEFDDAGTPLPGGAPGGGGIGGGGVADAMAGMGSPGAMSAMPSGLSSGGGSMPVAPGKPDPGLDSPPPSMGIDPATLLPDTGGDDDAPFDYDGSDMPPLI